MSQSNLSENTKSAAAKSGFATAQEEMEFLRWRVAELEQQNQQLYQQVYLGQQRLAASDMNERERMEFVAHVAHELRSPLTSIKGYVDLVLDGETGAINELQREFLSVAGVNAEKLANIIGNLLDVSKMEAGQLSFKPSVGEISELIFKVSEEIRPLLSVRGVRLEVNVPPGPPLYANFDQERIGQALRAVISYAGQISPYGKTVRVNLVRDTDNLTTTLEISDEAVPFLQEDLDRIFNKFWRPSNRAWEGDGGPGLGLNIARHIFEQHEGQVHATHSQDGEGNTYSLTLPILNRSFALSDQGELGKANAETPSYAVLVLSKTDELSQLLRKVLEPVGFEILQASHDSEFLSEEPAWQPDLVINNAAETTTLTREELAKLERKLRGASLVTLNLSEFEQKLLNLDVQAILPYPAVDSHLQEQLEQLIEPATDDTRQAVLLVSSDSDTLRGLERILQKLGITKIFRATREADALLLARRYRPNWLLVEIQDNETHTPELLEWLKDEPLLNKTPTIVFTNQSNLAPELLPNYRPAFVAKRGTTGSLKQARLVTNGNGGANDTSAADSSQWQFSNILPKPFVYKRLVNLAVRLASQKQKYKA